MSFQPLSEKEEALAKQIVNAAYTFHKIGAGFACPKDPAEKGLRNMFLS